MFDEFDQNLAYMYQKLFSTDGTTFGANFNQFYKSKINFKTEKWQKRAKNAGVITLKDLLYLLFPW